MFVPNQIFENALVSINRLSADAQPEWGAMTAIEMVKHVTAGFEISMNDKDIEILTPQEKLPSWKRFLMSDKPFVKGANKPAAYPFFEAKQSDDLEIQKENFKTSLNRLKREISNPEFWSVHESFGKLSNDETAMLHAKHIYHHFTQFGLM